jgi:hypothetical protein
MKNYLLVTAFFLTCGISSHATVLMGASCEVKGEVVEVATEKRQLCSGADKPCTEYDSPYAIINIEEVKGGDDCSFVKLDDNLKVDSGGDVNKLVLGNKFIVSLEKASSMGPAGVSSFLQWTNFKMLVADKILPEDYTVQGDVEPVKMAE